MKQHQRLWAALPILMATALLAGCPQSRLPDAPPIVPQPKASLAMMVPIGAPSSTVAPSVAGP